MAALPARKPARQLPIMEDFFDLHPRQSANTLDRTDNVIVSLADKRMHGFLQSRLGANAVESMLIVFCNESGDYLIDEQVGWGDISTVELDLPCLLRRALIIGASSFLMVHNHPSGNCWPSDNDIYATRRVAKAADLVGLHVIDHLVVTHCQCYSMRAGAIV
ncbi:JAB domain-containing protein [Pontixanthobacter sp.]|uniref:JAB domain-containing protein n=1 Tax=Pontixanthobacter sp. TaxID=2792078 RepID=UPI003C7D4AF3